MPTTLSKDPTVDYIMKLPHGHSLFIAVPERYTDRDRSGELCFTPAGVRFLDKVRVLAMDQAIRPTSGYILTVRQALGMTQAQFGNALDVDKMTVYRWEHGSMKPGKDSLEKLRVLIQTHKRRGIVL